MAGEEGDWATAKTRRTLVLQLLSRVRGVERSCSDSQHANMRSMLLVLPVLPSARAMVGFHRFPADHPLARSHAASQRGRCVS